MCSLAGGIEGPVVIFDDDHYYMGGVLAEKLRLEGLDVTLVTPAADVSKWTHATLEQGWIEQRLYEIGVTIIEKHALTSAANGEARIQHTQSGRERALPCASLLLVTMRLPNDTLYHDLAADAARLQDAGIVSLTRIGDCLAPLDDRRRRLCRPPLRAGSRCTAGGRRAVPAGAGCAGLNEHFAGQRDVA